MAFDLVISDQAFADLDSLTGYLTQAAGLTTARRWFASIISAIETLAEMPSRCPLVDDLEDITEDVRLLLHGPRTRAYKIYFEIQLKNDGTSPDGTVFVFHIRHWARKPLTAEELDELMDDDASPS